MSTVFLQNQSDTKCWYHFPGFRHQLKIPVKGRAWWKSASLNTEGQGGDSSKTRVSSEAPARAAAISCVSPRHVVVVPLIINPCIDVIKFAQAFNGCLDVKNEE